MIIKKIIEQRILIRNEIVNEYEHLIICKNCGKVLMKGKYAQNEHVYNIEIKCNNYDRVRGTKCKTINRI